MNRRPTQRQRILEVLRERTGRWVPAYDLAQVALQFCARIAELRRDGHTIENRHGARPRADTLLLPPGADTGPAGALAGRWGRGVKSLEAGRP